MAQQKRQAAQAEVAHLPLWLRPLLSWLAERARRAAAQREAGKSTMVALLEPLRKIVLEIGRRMVEAGVLDEQNDIFFLTWSDLLAFLEGEWDGRGARALVADRRAQRNNWLAETPPDIFMCDAQGRPAELPSAAENEAMPAVHYTGGQASRHARELHGVAASPGQATGQARIIRQRLMFWSALIVLVGIRTFFLPLQENLVLILIVAVVPALIALIPIWEVLRYARS